MGTARGLFITGTSTGVGKTYVGTLLARALVQAGCRVGVYKPVESGCRHDGQAVIAEDACRLWEAAGRPGELSQVCPQRFVAALAPPQAAARENARVEADLLRNGFRYWQQRSELVLVEGAGGLMSPLSSRDYNADLAADLGLPLVIVAANQLGVINATLQTIITARAVAPGLPIAGVILNQTQQRADDLSVEGNAAQLRERCDVPLLATVECGQRALADPVDWLALARCE